MSLAEQRNDMQTRVWSVGGVRVTQVVETVAFRPLPTLLPPAEPRHWRDLSWLRPDYLTDEDGAVLSIGCYLLETEDRLIIVDTGFGNGKTREVYRTGHQRDSDFLERVTAAGGDPDRVDTVVSTHLHVDHVGWNTRWVDGRWTPTFPNARYLMNQTELDYWGSISGEPGTHAGDDAQVFADSVEPVIDAGLVDIVGLDHQISPEVTFVPTPGHTPGHACLRISSQGEEGWILGDLAHHPIQVTYPELHNSGDHDPTASTRSREMVWDLLADTQILVFGTHWAGDVARIVSDGERRRVVPAGHSE